MCCGEGSEQRLVIATFLIPRQLAVNVASQAPGQQHACSLQHVRIGKLDRLPETANLRQGRKASNLNQK